MVPGLSMKPQVGDAVVEDGVREKTGEFYVEADAVIQGDVVEGAGGGVLRTSRAELKPFGGRGEREKG